MSGVGAGYRAFDRFQQRQPWLGFPLAVLQKYADDQGGFLAASITYYGFFAIFPLLLVLTTVLGFLLRGHPHLSASIVSSALAQFPVIGHDLRVGSLHGSTLALGLGLGAALWAGIGVFLASENAMNHLWGVPFKRRPDFIRLRGRALLLLVMLGGGLLATTVLAGFAGFGASYATAYKIGSVVLSTVLNFALFWAGFRVLTARDVSWRQLRGGAIGAAILYESLQALGGYYVGHVLEHTSNTYGTFGLVIGLLSWIYLAAHITLLTAEVNVVATKRLWPRSFSFVIQQPLTPADKRALTQRGRIEERRDDETVTISFPAPDETKAATVRHLLNAPQSPAQGRQPMTERCDLVTFVTRVRIKDGREQEWDEAFTRHLQKAREQVGFESAQLCRAEDTPDERLIITSWRTDAHREAWHHQSALNDTRSELQQPGDGYSEPRSYTVIAAERH